MSNETVGRRAAVTAGHPDAACAAFRVLSSGGSVVDAAISASAVLSVSLPHASSLGGDAFFLVREGSSGKIHGLNASGTAPHEATPARFREGMASHGALAPVVPGLVLGWEALHRRFGAKPWESLYSDAIGMAETGCVINASLGSAIAASESLLRLDPGCTDVFFSSGSARCTGTLLRQPALAKTLRAVAKSGASAFYSGEVGVQLAGYIQSAGGLLGLEDLKRFSVAWVDPICANYKGFNIIVMPPNSFGILMLMQLNCLNGLPTENLTDDVTARVLWQIRAMRASFHVGLREIGDPRSMNRTSSDLLTAQTIAHVRELMFAAPSEPLPAPIGGTACVTIADAYGNAVCIVQSIFNPFGAHFLDPNTGILLNNRMFGFEHAPGRVNSVGPGKHCAHTLNPVMVTKDGQLRWVYASPGGINQTIIGTQVLVNLIDREIGITSAVSEGRWGVDRNGLLLMESIVPSDVSLALDSIGLQVRRIDDISLLGSATVIQCGPDNLIRAVADNRRDASVVCL